MVCSRLPPPFPRNSKFDSRSSTSDFTQEITLQLFSRFKHFQLCVVDYPPPLEMVSLTQDQALLISHRKLPSNCV